MIKDTNGLVYVFLFAVLLLVMAGGGVVSYVASEVGKTKMIEQKDTEILALTEEIVALNKTITLLEETPKIKDFSSIAALESWVSYYSYDMYIINVFDFALETQARGLRDGYLISVSYDEDRIPPYEGDANTGKIVCSAFVNGELYYWLPYDTTIYPTGLRKGAIK